MSTSTPPLSFDRAHFEGDPPPPDACVFCRREIEDQYYRVGEHMACPTCAANAQSLVPPDSHKAFTKAVLFGCMAAVLGCIAYATFTIATGITLGYAAIGVGWLIGWSMHKGSGGLGGRRYQVVAAVLTYAAVAVAFVPMAMHEMGKGHAQKTTASATQTPGADSGATGKAADDAPKKPIGFGGFVAAVAMLLGIGLISPFLEIANSVGSGMLNLFIIFIGIRFAWKFAAGNRLSVEGPFEQNPAPVQSSL